MYMYVITSHTCTCTFNGWENAANCISIENGWEEETGMIGAGGGAMVTEGITGPEGGGLLNPVKSAKSGIPSFVDPRVL